MTEAQARKQLRRMLHSMTAGSVLHLLSEVFAAAARRSQRKGNPKAQGKFEEVASMLFVVGLGIDAVWQRP